MDGLSQKILKNGQIRAKNPHYHLIKYMFNFKVFDILLFLILRHHKEINDMIVNSGSEMIDYAKLENLYYTPLKGFKVIMQRLIFDLKNYDGAAVEYVGQILNLLVKFSVGEEFILGSEIVDIKHQNLLGGETNDKIGQMDVGEWIQFDKNVKRNDIEEYKNGESKSLASSDTRLTNFFNHLNKQDYTDKVWERNMKATPFCYNSNNWSLYLNSIASSLMREALGEAGVGSANH